MKPTKLMSPLMDVGSRWWDSAVLCAHGENKNAASPPTFQFPPALKNYLRLEPKQQRKNKKVKLLCFLPAFGLFVKRTQARLFGRSGAAWQREGRNNFITCHNLLLISIYPLGGLSRTLNSSGWRWTLLSFFFAAIQSERRCGCRVRPAEGTPLEWVCFIDQMKLTHTHKQAGKECVQSWSVAQPACLI